MIVAHNDAGAQGIRVGTGRTSTAADSPTLSITIEGNTISQTDGPGILAAAGHLNVYVF